MKDILKRSTIATLILLLIIYSCLSFLFAPYQEKTSDATPNESIEVFIVAHSHDDVGWKKMWGEYYGEEVKFIFESLLNALEVSQERKFMQVEIAFFSRWWDEIDEVKRKRVKKLIENEQLEFNLGGVCMNDEATTTYHEQINQMTNGAMWLQENLGVKPRSAWQIDAFGHSSSTATMMSQIEFPAYVINRIPFQIKNEMKKEKGLEFIWRPSPSFGSYREIFTHVLSDHYHTPKSFNFTGNFTVENVAQSVSKELQERQRYYRHNKQIVTWGHDFAHQNSEKDYDNMDKLMKYVNANPYLNITLRYAFISEYFEQVRKLNLNWDVREGDFFPHSDRNHSYWTGYYTSRPWLKILIRQCDSILQTAETLLALSNDKTNFSYMNSKIDKLRFATSLSTHHDAITGTGKHFVNQDYIRLLKNGSDLTISAIETMVSKVFIPLTSSTRSIKSFAIHNPLAWSRKEITSIPTDHSSATVECGGVSVSSQMNPIPFFSKVSYKYRLYFMVSIPPLSTMICNIEFGNVPLKTKEKGGTISNTDSELYFDYSTKKLTIIRNKDKKILAEMDLFQYHSNKRKDGAYLFSPKLDRNTSRPILDQISEKLKAKWIVGDLVTELQLYYKNNFGQTILSFQGSENFSKFFEIVNEVGPLQKGRQLIVRFNTNMKTNGTFYTDSGLEIMKRTLQQKDTDFITGNYYPTVQRVFIRDEEEMLQFTLLTDSSHGSSSLKEGSLELMLHRRCINDDRKGLEEILDDTDPIRTSIWMTLKGFEEGIVDARYLSILQQFPLTPHPLSSPFQANEFSFGIGELPPNVHLLTLRKLRDKTFLIRLQHIYAINEHPQLSSPVQINLRDYLKHFHVNKITEMNLTGTERLLPSKIKWGRNQPPTLYEPIPFTDDGIIILQPLEIRTFLIMSL